MHEIIKILKNENYGYTLFDKGDTGYKSFQSDFINISKKDATTIISNTLFQCLYKNDRVSFIPEINDDSIKYLKSAIKLKSDYILIDTYDLPVSIIATRGERSLT